MKAMIICNHKKKQNKLIKQKELIIGGKKMVVGEIIRCCTVDEVIRKAFELKDRGIITEFISNYTLRVVAVEA